MCALVEMLRRLNSP